MLDYLEKLDHWLFYAVNSRMATPWLDDFLPAVTDLHKDPRFVYIAFPALLLFWIYTGRAKALKLILGLTICVGCVDMVTYRLLKPTFRRHRPPNIIKTVELRTDRYAGFSFPSNHASNNFAAATFLSLGYPPFTPIFFSVAGVIALSRVYVGVHFPFDVLVGALWASLFAFVFFLGWKQLLKIDVHKKTRK